MVEEKFQTKEVKETNKSTGYNNFRPENQNKRNNAYAYSHSYMPSITTE